MATNNIKPFATGAGANVTSQADWEALPALATGFQSGKASSAQINKAIRQALFIASALAQYTSDKSGLDVLDDGDVAGFVTKMETAFGKDFQPKDDTLSAFAGLSSAANKLPYFTGVDALALADLTTAARTLLSKESTGDMLSYLGLGDGHGRLLGSPKIFTSSGTYTPTTGTTFVIVECLGGGGGGGGCAANGSGQASGGQGGGAGSYGVGYFTTGFSGVTMSIGTAGTAGASGVNDGGAGGTTSFGSLLSVSGGLGGKSGQAVTLVAIGQTPTANTATITGANLYSMPGDDGWSSILAKTVAPANLSGRGASSKYGKGGSAISAQGDGSAAIGRGAGGSGGISYASAAAQAGGAGTAGMIVIWEYA